MEYKIGSEDLEILKDAYKKKRRSQRRYSFHAGANIEIIYNV
jgi:hypothetical protein